MTWIIWNKSQESNNIYKSYKIPRNKFNQRGENSSQWKLQKVDKWNWKGHTKMRRHCGEESILLKYPYYPKLSTDAVWSPSKHQWNSHRTWKINPTFCVKWQKTLNSQSNIEPKRTKESLYYLISKYTLYIISDQNIVLS
jgi:hypothetical protein